MNNLAINKSPKRSLGMTLIEVMIASVILFAAIGVVSGVHRVLNHYQRQNIADYALLLNQQSFFDYVSYSLDQGIVSGEYEINNFQLVWQADIKKSGPVIERFEPDLPAGSQFSSYSNMLLYKVNYYLKQYPEKSFEIILFTVDNPEASKGL